MYGFPTYPEWEEVVVAVVPVPVVRRAALFQEVCDLGAQAWMTGTEIDVFQELGDRAQAIQVTDANGLSTCTQHDTCLI